MKNQIGFIVTHNWYSTDYEEQGHENHDILFSTKEKAQEFVDISLAYLFNQWLDQEVEGVKIAEEFDEILAMDDYGNDMIFDSWDIEPIFTEE